MDPSEARMGLLVGRERGASPSRTRNDAPLTCLRLRAGLSIPSLAERFEVSTATIARWCDGSRRPPIVFVDFLRRAAVGDLDQIERQQAEYARGRRRSASPVIRLEIRLPDGYSVADAKERAADAVGKALARGKGAR